MTTIVKCKKCGCVLERRDDDLPGRSNEKDWIQEMLDRCKGHCPKCGRKLPSREEYAKVVGFECVPNPETAHLSPMVSAFSHDYHDSDYVRIKRRG